MDRNPLVVLDVFFYVSKLSMVSFLTDMDSVITYQIVKNLATYRRNLSDF